MDRENFFDNLRDDSGGPAELLRARRQLAYEERVIKRVFSECGIKINGWGRFANQCRDMTGQDKLNFNWFNSVFTHFPGTLCGRRIPGLFKLQLVDLFKPRQNRLARAVVKALRGYNLEPQSSSFVLVFPVVRTSFCAHSMTRLKASNRISLQLAYEDFTLTIEPTAGFGRAIGSDWFET